MPRTFASEEERRLLKDKINDLPVTSGCYLMKSKEQVVIYVGKAKNLRARVRSYFASNLSNKVAQLMSRVVYIEIFTTNTEYEALLLENNLIKKYHPFYNINLKDGKTYPLIRVTKEAYPRIFRTRNIVNDGSTYYGPYVNLRQMDAILEAVDRLYPLRKCKEIPLRRRREPCLFYHLGRCGAPCVGKISQEKYEESLRQVKELLKGNFKEFKKIMTQKMWQAAEILNFEQASLINEILKSLSLLEENQDVEQVSNSCADYLGIIEESGNASVVVLQVREGKLIGRESFLFRTVNEESEALEHFIWQYYDQAELIPSEIYLDHALPTDLEGLLKRGLREKSGRNIKLLQPKAGRHFRLLGIAKENAVLCLNTQKNKKKVLEKLMSILKLPAVPLRIEGIDIAHIDGKYPVGVVVSFWEGKPDKTAYRLYNLRSLDGQIDDYKAIKEVIVRHYRKKDKFPDLLLIDGGKGQLNAALSLMQELQIRFPVCSLAKRLEEIFVFGQKEPIVLPLGDQSLAILQAVRDEAHRFATQQNRKLMGKHLQKLEVNQIPGVGPKRAKKILESFPSLSLLKKAELKDLQEVLGISMALAQKIHEWAKQKKDQESSRLHTLDEFTVEELD